MKALVYSVLYFTHSQCLCVAAGSELQMQASVLLAQWSVCLYCRLVPWWRGSMLLEREPE